MALTDRWTTEAVVCDGGLVLDQAGLLQGTTLTGTATSLINYEPALEGGYQRIEGFQKFDSTTVPGEVGSPILGVGVSLGGVFAARKNVAATSIDIYFSSGSGWGSKINTANRSTAASKYRSVEYSITEPVIVFTDGVAPALKYNGTTDTLINGTGAPTAPKFAELFVNRLVLAPATNTSSIAISSAISDTDFDGTNGAVEINVGDVVVGIKRFRDQLYIFCENSIFKLIGNTNTTFQLQPVTRSIGCISGDSVQELGGDLVFLAPDGFRSVAATERIGDTELGLLSKAIQPVVRPVIGSLTADAYSAIVIRKKSQYRLFLNEGQPDATSRGFLGKLSGTQAGIGYEWATLQGINAFSAASSYEGATEISVIGHPTSGFVFRLEAGNDFDGTPVFALYESPDLTFNQPDNRKVIYKLALNMQLSGNLDIELQATFDNDADDTKQPLPITIAQSGEVPTYGTAVYGTDDYGALTFPTFRRNLIGSGFTTSFAYSSTDSNPPHRIDSFTIQYTIKGRR